MQSEPLKQRLCLAPNKSFLQVSKEFDCGFFAMKHSHVLGQRHRDQLHQCPGGFQAPASTASGRRNQNSHLGSSTKAIRALVPAPSEGWGALVGGGAASASQGNRAAPAPQCWVQTSRDPAVANCGFIPKQNKSALPKVPRNQRLYSNKIIFPIAALRAQDQPRNLLHKHGQVKHCLKLKILPLASPPPHSHPSSSDPWQTNLLLALGSSSRALGPSGTAGKRGFFPQ